MSEFPTLTEMGITRLRQISRYTLTPDGTNDVLRIHYRRESGSILPKSRKYQFGRSPKMVMVDSGSQKIVETYEISAFLLRAMVELDQIVKDEKSVSESRDTLLRQVNELETLMLNKLSELRMEIEHCKT